MVDLERMIAAQHSLQYSLGYDITQMSTEERINYIRENVLALNAELFEMLQEIGWKSWASSRHINSTEAFHELRDAWQFLTNLMLAVSGDRPDEVAKLLEQTLYDKHAVNVARNDNGYDGVSGKCPSCKRDLGEVVLMEVMNPSGVMYLCECGEKLKHDLVAPYVND